MFGFRFDKKSLLIIAGIFLFFTLINLGTSGILNLLYTLPAVLIAMTFHEFAHALAADKLGDDTPRLQGRLNLNPLNHIDPIGIVLLIVAHFGWGKPVEIDSRNFNGKISISAAEAIVAAAGPIMNFIVAFVTLIINYALFATNLGNFIPENIGLIIYKILLYTTIINIGLGVFNLIPLPPLDGSKILMHFLPYNGKKWFRENEQLFYIVFLLMFISGASANIITPIFSYIYNGMDWLVRLIFGLFI